jgi:hypothetical protein
LTSDLTLLLEDYIRAQPNRALGGVRALSGFEYQARSYFAEFVRALVHGDYLAREGEVLANPTHGPSLAESSEAGIDSAHSKSAVASCILVNPRTGAVRQRRFLR